ncbi:MAG TPA: A/G-specific adenine glycosylase [Candidatus Deferrimicrobiaceae bacterium]
MKPSPRNVPSRTTFLRISAALLRWFRKEGRRMAWRETRDPYRIWVSEIMLQQTRVETVAPYYGRFLARFPDVRTLAAAAPDEVMKAWEGLGYYARARNLQKAARTVMERYGGEIPGTVEELEGLPGIGRSTAGAIAAIAFGVDAPVLDANASRVVARLFGIRGDPRAAGVRSALWDLSGRMVARGKGRDTALAAMDLGATVCSPRSPRCGGCPVRGFCVAFREGIQEAIPPRAARRTVPRHDVVAALFRRPDGALLLVRRPPEGLLGGLWAFPSGRRAPGESLEEALRRALREKLRLRARIQRKVGAVSHAYSHYRITLHGYLCVPGAGAVPSGERAGWFLPGGKTRYALPRADRKLVELILREEGP